LWLALPNEATSKHPTTRKVKRHFKKANVALGMRTMSGVCDQEGLPSINFTQLFLRFESGNQVNLLGEIYEDLGFVFNPLMPREKRCTKKLLNSILLGYGEPCMPSASAMIFGNLFRW
jgi:hypothetical protein